MLRYKDDGPMQAKAGEGMLVHAEMSDLTPLQYATRCSDMAGKQALCTCCLLVTPQADKSSKQRISRPTACMLRFRGYTEVSH